MSGAPRKRLLFAAVLLFSVACVFVQKGNTSPAQLRLQPEKAIEISVIGCLSGQPESFELTDASGNVYRLIGRASFVGKYIGEEVRVRGTETSSTEPAINVITVKEVLKPSTPTLSSSIRYTASFGRTCAKSHIMLTLCGT
jgi:hypothetical protein